MSATTAKKQIGAAQARAILEAAFANIVRKVHDAEQMAASMIEHMHDISSETIRGTTRESTEYKTQEEMRLPAFI